MKPSFRVWAAGAVLTLCLNAGLAVAQEKPNILVIFGDDIGMWNVGAYTHGMMGRTPNIDSIAKDGILFTDHYAPAELHRRPRGLHHGPAAGAHRHDHHRHSGLDARHPEGRSDARRGPEVRRLQHRAVRQEPPGRPQRVPADRARLRRVVRQPLPPQRRGGAGGAGLSGPEEPGLHREVRSARRAAHLGDRRGRSDGRSEVRAASASRRSRTPGR